VIRSRKSKYIQYNGQMTKCDSQNTTHKAKSLSNTDPTKNWG
jgi:hypothetical protein